jgi:TM2 domain-containing membrane protein YozV
MKDKNTAGILALLLGGIGGHKFYLGQTGMGLLYFLFCWTFIPACVAFIEAIVLFTMNESTFNARFNASYMPMRAVALPVQQPQNIVVNVANTASGGGATTDVAARLKSLHELKLSGALTEEEFTVEKKKLLAG